MVLSLASLRLLPSGPQGPCLLSSRMLPNSPTGPHMLHDFADGVPSMWQALCIPLGLSKFQPSAHFLGEAPAPPREG